MKRALLLTFCTVLSACSTFLPVPESSLAYSAASRATFYSTAYPSYFSGYSPYYFGLGHSTAFGYTPHYYRGRNFSHSGSITLGLGYDPLHGASLLGGHSGSLGHGNGYSGHSLGHGIGHGRRH